MTAANDNDREIYGPHAMRLSWPVRAAFGLLVVIGLVSLGFGSASRSSDQRAARSDELRACATSFAAELVTGPTAAALKALADDGADSKAFRDAVADADPARYIELSRLARTNPDAFLRECHRSTG